MTRQGRLVDAVTTSRTTLADRKKFLMDLPLQSLLSELDAEYTGRLPMGALRESQRRGTEMIPHLIGLIRKSTEAARAGEVPKSNGHLFAMYLLAELRAKEALGPIIEAVSLPGECPFDLFGDSITEDLHRILAVLAVDQPESIDHLIADQSINEYVRWQAARTYRHWVREGRWTRDQAVQRLRSHLRTAIRRADDERTTGLVSELATYSPHDCHCEIAEAFRRGLVDELVVSEELIARSIAEGESWLETELGHLPPTGIQDTVDEMKHWACFSGH